MIVILGAGLAGLSTAYHLRREHVVLEREREIGGLARSVDAGGFLFDFTGHLLHVRDPYVRDLCDRLLGDQQVHLERSAWIDHGGCLVPYPFQVHTARLPVEVRVDCLRGFAESLLPENRLPPGELRGPKRSLPLSFLNVKTPTGGYARSFRDWTVHTFGDGFARHFFLDYNRKNFAAPLDTISADWVSWAVPKPDLEDVLRGALGMDRKEYGYNPRFRYPSQGGIRRLPDALGRALKDVRLQAGVQRIDARHKVVHLEDGGRIGYRHLVATLPLPELIGMIDDLEPAVREAAARLRWCAVSSFNFGLRGGLGHDRHWIYYPDPSLCFYRVGFPSNLAPAMAPAGASSICAEVAYPSDRFPPPAGEEERVLDDLVRCGALPDRGRVVQRTRLDLPFAYVLFDDARRAALPVLFDALLCRDILPVGRYGAWDYLSMEQTILQGKEAAEYLDGRV